MAAIAAMTVLVAACSDKPAHPRDSVAGLPLRSIGEVALPGDNSRFDYASLDPTRGLLFVAHLGASEVVEVDVRANRVVRTIPNVSQVHGVLVVGPLNRVYATATGVNQVVAIDETTGTEIGRAPTRQYPDGLAYDPRRNRVWTTNESGGTETVLDAATLQPKATVALGGEVGNVGYDQNSDRMLVAVQARNDLAVIDPATLTVTRRVDLPGCQHPHGLSVDGPDGLVFVACDQNATLLAIDQTNWTVTASNPVGEEPDVLAYDPSAHRLYMAAESGTLTTFDLRDHTLAVIGSGHLADGAHVVAVDAGTHRSYYPVPASTTATQPCWNANPPDHRRDAMLSRGVNRPGCCALRSRCHRLPRRRRTPFGAYVGHAGMRRSHGRCREDCRDAARRAGRPRPGAAAGVAAALRCVAEMFAEVPEGGHTATRFGCWPTSAACRATCCQQPAPRPAEALRQ